MMSSLHRQVSSVAFASRVAPLAAGMLLVASAVTAQDGANLPEPRLAARVNGEEILLVDVSKAVNRYVVANRLGPHSDVSIPEIQRTVLERLIAITLAAQRAKELKLGPTPEEIEARIFDIRSEFGSPEEFRLMMTVQNLTEDGLRAQVSREMAVERLINEEIFRKMEIPAAAVQAYYDSHPEAMRKSERAKLRHIFVGIRSDMTEEERSAARSKIDSIKGRLDAGESFKDLAIELSEDPAAASGGDLGWLRRDDVTGPFQLVAFTTPLGGVSDVVATDYGYHIIEVLDREEATMKSLEEARPDIVAKLRDERMDEAVRDYLAQLRQEAQVETFIFEGDPGS